MHASAATTFDRATGDLLERSEQLSTLAGCLEAVTRDSRGRLLAVGGEAGVAALVQQFAAETDLTLALMGASSVRELDTSWIAASF